MAFAYQSLAQKHSNHGGLYKKCARRRAWLVEIKKGSRKVIKLHHWKHFSVFIHFAPKSTYKGMLARYETVKYNDI